MISSASVKEGESERVCHTHTKRERSAANLLPALGICCEYPWGLRTDEERANSLIIGWPLGQSKNSLLAERRVDLHRHG
jgi:hypothetical protein